MLMADLRQFWGAAVFPSEKDGVDVDRQEMPTIPDCNLIGADPAPDEPHRGNPSTTTSCSSKTFLLFPFKACNFELDDLTVVDGHDDFAVRFADSERRFSSLFPVFADSFKFVTASFGLDSCFSMLTAWR